MKERIYSYKDVDMLLASRTIAENFKAQLPKLAAIRINWNESYADDLSLRIDTTIDDYLGVDKKRELKEASEKVLSFQSLAINDLTFLKAQIKIDLPDKAEKILKKLGFSKFTKGVFNGNQEQLIEVLFSLKKEMTDQMKSEICSKGINPVLIDRLIETADQLKHFNTIQESLKKSTKEVTGEMRAKFNEIYNEVSGVCKIARIYFKSDPLIQEQFVFSGIVGNMHAN